MGSIPVRRANKCECDEIGNHSRLKICRFRACRFESGHSHHTTHMDIMNERIREILIITQEEAAEVIQEISKCFRFGINTEDRSGVLHRERLEQEIADFLVMVDLLEEEGIVTENGITAAKLRKVKKLQVWSKIYRT